MLTCPPYRVSKFLFSLLCRTWDCWLFCLFAYRWCGIKDIDWMVDNSLIPWTKEDGNKKDRDDVEVDRGTVPFLNLIMKWCHYKLEILVSFSLQISNTIRKPKNDRSLNLFLFLRVISISQIFANLMKILSSTFMLLML